MWQPYCYYPFIPTSVWGLFVLLTPFNVRNGGSCDIFDEMRFQVMSDIHLEVGSQYSTFKIPSCAPNLILAGDIGRLSDYDLFADFLESQCANFQQVFLVLGNHEFYGISRANGLKLAAQLEDEPRFNKRLRILNRTRIELAENITLLGCTLQSHITPGSQQIIQSKIQDFRRIVDWTITDHNNEHETDVKWLKANIEQIRANTPHCTHRIIIITHHAPVRKGSSRPEHEQNPWTDAFATELLGDSENQETNPLQAVNYWVFGHTHFSTEFCRGRVRIISNQRGYVLGQNRCEKETEDSKENPESQSKLPLFKKLLGSILARQGSRQRALTTQTGSKPLPSQKGFDIRKCIEI